MGFLSRFEGRMEDTFEGAADKMFDAPISPVQIAKKAEKQMRREKMVGAGKQYAPTLYTVLVNPDDDRRLMGYYPTLAGETETYLTAKASEQGLVMDGQPLVRFIVDEDLKHGKFDIIAEAVAAPIIAQLRAEEMHRYGLAAAPAPGGYGAPAQPYPAPRPQAPAPQQYGGYNQGYAAPAPAPAPYGGYDQHDPQGQYDPAPMNVDAYGQPQQLPYVPEDEIDRSIDYGEYTFDSRDFDEQRDSIQPLDRPEAVDPFAIGAAAAGAGVAAGAVAGAGMGAATSQPYPAPQPQPQAQPRMAAETVVFAGGQQAATPMPAQAAVRARLIDTTNNRAYDLASARLLIGRESKNDIAVHDVNASRTHAELRFEPQGVWTITDLGSTNGTLVNGREVATQPLSEGDRITIGMTNFMFTQA
ncbi:DUF2662 domain-containing protein [Eggerthella lenta]|jgi:hypothetical protein|uniref:FHA domain containing protein n=6 Tax=Eggerthella TaxID=84111 RepID=C8WPN8_EGGLE|nr:MULTISPECIES: DUF3662 and FHA domain-containing protein [Eggerthella]ACV56982.1 FHA domain containing protein [Eggerthella lenta DSM 2243]EGC89426.1 FHA domain protein [Eggerthella sp. HGA1]KGI74479.1 hypothetical protein HMPREF9458_00746 [Eggerthella lenta 1_1_60AFAA]MBU5398508.1 FHA domain-containing protein [Eggerthella lenta]MBU9892552.1 FHA domain-containing protein [Eggerthella lenta]